MITVVRCASSLCQRDGCLIDAIAVVGAETPGICRGGPRLSVFGGSIPVKTVFWDAVFGQLFQWGPSRRNIPLPKKTIDWGKLEAPNGQN